MKAGSAQKMILNMLSTGAMIKLGKVYGNLMVDVKASNKKLEERACRIVMEAADVNREAATAALQATKGQAKLAIFMLLGKLDLSTASKLLTSHQGFISEALQKISIATSCQQAGAVMNPQKIAKDIYALIGPKENILQTENCMTRLRLVLKDKSKLDLTALRQVSGVLGLHDAGNELQVILGPGRVLQVHKALADLLAGAETAAPAPQIGQGQELHEQIRQKNATPFKLLLKRIASIFLPLIPAFIACGLITGILNVALKADPTIASAPLIQLLQIAGNAAFWGINIFVGINAAKEFGASPMLGGTMAVIISHPGLSSIELFGQPLQPGRGGIIAVLLVVAFSSWLEKHLHRLVPELFDLFLTPLLVIIISTFVAIFMLQPVGGLISENIGFAAAKAVADGGAFTGFILGGTFLPLVMTGLHQGITPHSCRTVKSLGYNHFTAHFSYGRCRAGGRSRRCLLPHQE